MQLPIVENLIQFVLIWIAFNCIKIITRNTFIFWTSDQRTPNTVHLPQIFGVWSWVRTTGNSANTDSIDQTSDESQTLVTNKYNHYKKHHHFMDQWTMSSEHSACLPQTYVGWLCCSYIVDLALNSLFFADFYSLRAHINCWEHDTLLKDLTTKNFSRSTIKEPTQPHSMLKLILCGHFLGSKMKLQKSNNLKSCLSDYRSIRWS